MSAALAPRSQAPFFELALRHGLASGRITGARLDAINTEAPKGLVQIARYFGTEYLRPELELARERFVNLISLHLMDATGGRLDAAADLLAQHTLLSRSKAGADLLKALIVSPQATHLGMNERGGFSDRHIGALARWSLATWDEVQAERAQREHAAHTVQAALALAAELGLDADDLADAEPDAEAVIRTALLVRAAGRAELPDWAGFEALIQALRRRSADAVAKALSVPSGLPAAQQTVVATLLASVQADLPRILTPGLSCRKLFDQTPALMGRYFWREDALAEVVNLDRHRSAVWQRLTSNHDDDGTVLTLLVGVAAAATPRAVLTEKQALALIRKIRKNGWHPGAAWDFLRTHAPAEHLEDYERLWRDFSDSAQALLTSDQIGSLQDALALLKRECNVY